MRIAELRLVPVITIRDLRMPQNADDVARCRTLAGVMMQHHVTLPWWDIQRKLATYISARAYAQRSLQGPRS